MLFRSSEAAGTLDEIFEEVLSEDPMLRSFHLLREKVIRTAKEKSDYQSMLADKALLTESYNELSAAYINKNLDQGEELRRLMRIQYLNAALDWRDNPSRSIALDAIRQLLLAQFSSSDDRSAVAYGSLLGDKFDLFQHLMLSDPQEAERLLAQAKGTSSEKILRLAYEMAKQHNQHAN